MKTPLFFTFVCVVGIAFFVISPLYPNQFAVQFLGSLAFWLGLGYLLMKYPLKNAISRVRSGGRTSFGVLILYLMAHYLAYSLLLSRLTDLPVEKTLGLTYAPMSTVDLQNLLGILFSPSLSAGWGGIYVDLSLFSILMGLVIGTLVTANLEELKYLRGAKREASLIGIPMAGIITGSTCCVSIATVVYYYVPLISLSLAVASILLNFTYFSLPIITAIFLWLNLRTLMGFHGKIVKKNPEVKVDK
ncbi:hypothetical protein GWK48_07720 [Metallosphaera tengchongensis]|uniref:Uncharacterized protein n=1 Tax=Metallosphaera tengchongensis TaxID=1532350 RepID=A0A6N0NY23_9CREN|nr:hypothetical protein [Metallosphaera tengchongensis]QKR00278.1 hypothetical protein GWK48_07720 [Metallosphaera tengchongensis]